MKVERQIIQAENAPRAIGPYSQAVATGEFIFTSGQLPINPVSGQIEVTDFDAQVRQVLDNLSAVLKAAGSDLKNILKCTVFLTDLNTFARLNAVFEEYFPESPPARSAVQVSRLPRDAQLEIEAIALKGNPSE